MGTLYLVRHGQASFGADDYDQLSPLGQQQAVRLGEFWRGRGQRFDAVLTGTLRRHGQTLAGIAEGLQCGLDALQWPGLDEYDSAALIAAIRPDLLPGADTVQRRSHYFRLLCSAMAQWMAGSIQPEGMPSWAAFSDGVRQALEHICVNHAGQQVLLVSSGGPISTAVAQVMGSAPEVVIGLNMRLRNSAVTEFSFSGKRLTLKTFNTLPHLNELTQADHISLI